ncbi:PilZ domain-containing protein [Synechococcus sp. CS-1332]|uniref:PilZ domain-containing protein n=1 Tax=Synechococcus sp. CS-1332 TaxID=2847972 RepID=UPI00223A8C22|nr:PilZ domain-containing protein [Synechococcus sp. CS-1332]MCT0207748.1 PilZ domain-containing protein [Synechococcus sp. CS-1332]
MSPEQTEGEGQLEELRTSLRHALPPGVSASIRLSSGRTVYVTVGDISRTGACVVRRGDLEVVENEEVLLDVSDYEQHQNVSLSARVQWVSTRSYNTLVGLVFTEGPLLPGTMLDQYLDRTLMPRGSGDS